MIKAVLFDLDGTLLDTAPDLVGATNELREELGLPPMPFEALRNVSSHGSLGLLQHGLNKTPEDEDFEALRQRFLDLYEARMTRETGLFEGLETLITSLEDKAVPWGIVTNKPGWLTEPLLKELGYWHRSATTVSGDTVAKRKPDPAPLYHACQQIRVDAKHCIYVGDAQRDIEAGNRANMKTVIAGYGYIEASENTSDWQADHYTATTAQLNELILQLV